MPEAFSSIADMRVVIDSSTDKLEAGLTAAQNLVKRFAAEGGQDLSLMDRALGLTAGSTEALASKLGGIIGKLNEFKMIYDGIVTGLDAVGSTVASQTGTEDEFGEVKKSAEELRESLIGGLGLAFEGVKNSALSTAASLVGLDESAANADVTAHSAAFGGFLLLKQAIDNIKFAWQTSFFSDAHQSNDVLEGRIATYTDMIGKLQSQLESLQQINILDNGADQSAVDDVKQTIAAYQTQVFVLSQLAGAQKIADDAQADAAVMRSKGIQSLQAEMEAMELNVETMRMSTTESAFYRAELKARAALEEEGLDDDAVQRTIDKLQDRYNDAAEAVDNFNAAKKHDSDVQSYLDRMVQETDGLRDRVAVLGMATAAADAYTSSARTARDIDKLGVLNSDQEATVDTQTTLQAQLRLQLMADADERQRQRQSDRENSTIDQTIQGMERQTASIKARTAALYDSSEAGRADAIAQQQIATLQARGIELSPERIAQIKDEAQAQAEATTAQVEAQQQMKLLGDIGNAVTSNLDSAFRRWASGSQVTVKEMAASILADLAEIEFKAAVLNPLANFLTGSQTGGSGILGSLLRLGGGSSSLPSASSWAAGTSVIPAFADGGDFRPGPMMVGERGPELLWPTFPGKVIPNNALPNAGGGGAPVTIQVVNNVNAQGAYPESIDDIKRALADTQASIPQVSLQAYQQAKDRGVV